MNNLGKEYLDQVNQLESIKLLLVGQDPYKTNATGIAFHKNTFDLLFEKSDENRCCGQDVLASLGFSEAVIRKNFKQPNEVWYYLLNKGIGIINISHSILDAPFIEGQSRKEFREKLFESNEEKIRSSKELNDPIIRKTHRTMLLGYGITYPIFKEFYKEFFGNPHEALIHPSYSNFLAGGEKQYEWRKTWEEPYLKETYIKFFKN